MTRQCTTVDGEPWRTIWSCTETPVTSGETIRTGHTLELTPTDPGLWAGRGRVELTHLAAPNTPLSSAFLANGRMSGVDYPCDAQPVVLRLLLRADIPPEAPVSLTLTGVELAASAGNPLTLTLGGSPVQSGAGAGGILVGASSCLDSAGICDDGSSCTTDFCDPVAKRCV